MAEGPKEEQDKKNVLEPKGMIYVYTKGNVEVGGSKVVTGQLHVINKLACVSLDSGAIHSFISTMLVDCLGRNKDSIE